MNWITSVENANDENDFVNKVILTANFHFFNTNTVYSLKNHNYKKFKNLFIKQHVETLI